MDENCKRQKEVERTYGGLLPAVEGHSLGTRYKVRAYSASCIITYFLYSNISDKNNKLFRTLKEPSRAGHS